jgi:toxin ParE1/3/4
VIPYIFHPGALREYEEAVSYYDIQGAELGDLFAYEVDSAIDKIRTHPKTWPLIGKRARRLRTKTFPYGIVYTFKRSLITIYAVMHLHRDPNYWHSRLK